MAARKLALEIDRTLKRVQEGVEAFDGIHDKMQATTHLPQKEKLENDLKTQIKKLQRLRDQIKTWLTSNDIKDKAALAEARKLIETQMERFKACEREMKTKAFSKEGLSAATKLDPKEQLKQEMSHWVGNMVEELGRQIEVTEAEVESLAGNVKKKGSKSGAVSRVVELEGLNERRKWHVNRLELILRLLENGNLEPDSVAALREDIAYFVESNQEEDFEEDEGIYDDLNLQEEEGLFDMANDDLQSSHDSQSVADASDIVVSSPMKPPVRSISGSKPSREASIDETPDVKSPPTNRSTSASAISSQPNRQRKATLEGGSVRPAISGPAPPLPKTSNISSIVAATAPAPRTAPVILPPIRYAAAAASAVKEAVLPPSLISQASNSNTTSSPAPSIPGPISSSAIAQGVKVTPAGSTVPLATVQPAQQGPMPSPGDLSLQTKDLSSGAPSTASPVRTDAASPAMSSASLVSSLPPNQPPQLAPSPAPSIPKSTATPPPQRLQTPDVSTSQVANVPLPPPTASSQQSVASGSSSHAQQAQQQQAQQHAAEQARLPNSLTDLVTSFESAKSKAQNADRDLASITKILESGYSNVPQASDAEKPKYYVPKQPYPTPQYYPQAPTAVLEQPAMYARFDNDTLFYIFYYQVGTYQQYLAAEELKKRAWRFHKQYLTWFQRANEPQAITEDYEQGVYLYFDWETAFASRRKNSFTFHYKYLEDGQ